MNYKLKKLLTSFFIFLLIFIFTLPVFANTSELPDISSKAAILVDNYTRNYFISEKH